MQESVHNIIFHGVASPWQMKDILKLFMFHMKVEKIAYRNFWITSPKL